MKLNKLPGVLGACLVLLAASGSADPDELAFDGVIRADESVELRSVADGILEAVLVDRGDRVEAGQVVARLEFKVEKAALDLAQARAGNRADLDLAKAELEHARKRFERNKTLREKGIVDDDRFDEIANEFRVAEIKVVQEEERVRIDELEHEKARVQWELRDIRSPIDGVVADRLRSAGEMVTRTGDDPILELVRIDPLEVDVRLPIALYATMKKGTKARLEIVGFPDHDARAEVVHIDARADAASGTFGVRLALPNPDRTLPAGLRCKVVFGN